MSPEGFKYYYNRESKARNDAHHVNTSYCVHTTGEAAWRVWVVWAAAEIAFASTAPTKFYTLTEHILYNTGTQFYTLTKHIVYIVRTQFIHLLGAYLYIVVATSRIKMRAGADSTVWGLRGGLQKAPCSVGAEERAPGSVMWLEKKADMSVLRPRRKVIIFPISVLWIDLPLLASLLCTQYC
jgi:hypothetical protein